MDCWHLLNVVCIERTVGIGSIVTSIIGVIGLVSIYLAYRQLRLGQRAQRTRIVIQLHKEFLGDETRTQFVYQLDYASGPRAWKFEPERTPNSEEERLLDGLLFFLSFVGSLVKNKDLKASDLDWLRSWVSIILENEQVLKYMEWMKQPDQLPHFSSFDGAVYLYAALFGRRTATFRRLSQYH